MAPSSSSLINLTNTLTINNKPFTVTLSDTVISWSYRKKLSICDKGKDNGASGTQVICKNQLPISELVNIEYVDRESPSSSDGTELEMVSLNSTAFRLHMIKRVPKHTWKLKSVEMVCASSAQCALWVDSVKSVLERYTNRPKSLLVFINPFGGKRRAKKIFEEKVAAIFDLAGITSHVIITEKANHAQEHIQKHDLNRYDGVVCVGGDGMFAELLNGLLIRHNTRLGVDLHNEAERLRQPPLRLGIIPAGSTDTVCYCTTGQNDPVTSALHIVIGDSMAVDVCSVRSSSNGNLIRFSVSMIGYGFLGDTLKDSDNLRWMGPQRYLVSGARQFLRNRSYQATVEYLPAEALHSDHHPGLLDGSRCYSGCDICKSASLLDLRGSAIFDKLSYSTAAENSMASGAVNSPEVDPDSILHSMDDTSDSISHTNVLTRPASTLSNVSPEDWQLTTGAFLGINAAIISCRCETSPDGMSPACHLGDGTADLVLVRNTSRLNYFRHLYRIQSQYSSQFDFDFVDVIRVKAFRLRLAATYPESGAPQISTSFHRLETDETNTTSRSTVLPSSVWNCDGELIQDPNISVRVHCQLIKVFARGIEKDVASLDRYTNICMSCTGIS